VHVTATNPSYSRYAPTLDGKYDGVGALYLPEGVYNLTFSVNFYKDQTAPNYRVTWNDNYSILPPFGLLCPTAGSVGGCDPPLTISSSPSNSTTGAVLLTASIDLPARNAAYTVTYSWSATRGHLNATTGRAVLWVPGSMAGKSVTFFASALIKTRSGAALVSQNITLSYQPVPEFSQVSVISFVTFLLAFAILLVNRKSRRPNPSFSR